MNHENCVKCLRTKVRELWLKKKFLSKRERLAHERPHVSGSSINTIEVNGEFLRQSMMVRRIRSFSWCYHMLRKTSWIIYIVCHVVVVLSSRRRLTIYWLTYKKRRISSDLNLFIRLILLFALDSSWDDAQKNSIVQSMLSHVEKNFLNYLYRVSCCSCSFFETKVNYLLINIQE
jgi:hypothetical protein